MTTDGQLTAMQGNVNSIITVHHQDITVQTNYSKIIKIVKMLKFGRCCIVGLEGPRGRTGSHKLFIKKHTLPHAGTEQLAPCQGDIYTVKFPWLAPIGWFE